MTTDQPRMFSFIQLEGKDQIKEKKESIEISFHFISIHRISHIHSIPLVRSFVSRTW